MTSQHDLVTMQHHRRPDTAWRTACRGLLPVAAVIAGLCQLPTTAQNLIQNGSFEEPVVSGDYAGHTTGQTIGGAWLVEHADVDVGVVRTYGIGSIFYPTPAGSQFCYLADGVSFSVLTQDIATPLTAGVTYELSFLQSAFYQNYTLRDGEVTVALSPTGGPAELTQVFNLSGYADWTERALAFSPAVSGPYTLRFSSTPGVPGNIDDVRLVEAAVPEPAACGLAAGLGLLALVGWRGWRRA